MDAPCLSCLGPPPDWFDDIIASDIFDGEDDGPQDTVMGQTKFDFEDDHV